MKKLIKHFFLGLIVVWGAVSVPSNIQGAMPIVNSEFEGDTERVFFHEDENVDEVMRVFSERYQWVLDIEQRQRIQERVIKRLNCSIGRHQRNKDLVLGMSALRDLYALRMKEQNIALMLDEHFTYQADPAQVMANILVVYEQDMFDNHMDKNMWHKIIGRVFDYTKYPELLEVKKPIFMSRLKEVLHVRDVKTTM